MEQGGGERAKRIEWVSSVEDVFSRLWQFSRDSSLLCYARLPLQLARSLTRSLTHSLAHSLTRHDLQSLLLHRLAHPRNELALSNNSKIRPLRLVPEARSSRGRQPFLPKNLQVATRDPAELVEPSR